MYHVKETKMAALGNKPMLEDFFQAEGICFRILLNSFLGGKPLPYLSKNDENVLFDNGLQYCKWMGPHVESVSRNHTCIKRKTSPYRRHVHVRSLK